MVSYIREESKLKVFENRILRRIFGPKRDENDRLIGLVVSMSDY